MVAVTTHDPTWVVLRTPETLSIVQPAPLTLKVVAPVPKPAEVVTVIGVPTVPVVRTLVMVIACGSRTTTGAAKVKVALLVAAV